MPTDSGATCGKCNSQVDEAASRCAACGYEPVDYLPGAIAVMGFLFTITWVGAIIGVPLMLAAVGFYVIRDDPDPTDEPSGLVRDKRS